MYNATNRQASKGHAMKLINKRNGSTITLNETQLWLLTQARKHHARANELRKMANEADKYAKACEQDLAKSLRENDLNVFKVVEDTSA